MISKTNAIGTREHIQVIDSIEGQGVTIEVLEYQKLQGASHPSAAVYLYYMQNSNIKVRQVAIRLNNGAVKIEPGAMSYFKGNISMVSGVTMSNMIGRAFKGAVTGENMACPEYTGSGLLVLEPSFKHFILTELGPGEHAIVDKGMFFCAEKSVTVEPVMNKNVSAALMGGEGIFQIQLKGPGVVVLESPAPMCEIDIIELNNEVLKVDGNFALLRIGNIDFTVERSAKTLLGSAVSGEGLVNVFRGTGVVWLAPLEKLYKSAHI